MSKAIFHKIYALLLVLALLFGQIGSGFLHNKHDAHEAVIDHNSSDSRQQPVLVKHGEHCKVCAVDWVHQFVAASFDVRTNDQQNIFPVSLQHISLAELSLPSTIGRGPPATC